MYQALDAYWVTSRIEGTPVPLLEAMSCGVCCLSTKVGVAPEIIIDGENGHLVDIGDAARFAALTAGLIEHPEQRNRMGRNARDIIVNQYDWSNTAASAAILYQKAIERFEQQYPLGSRSKGNGWAASSAHCFDTDSDQPAADSGILGPEVETWLGDMERLLWTRDLCRMGERKYALRFGWRACLNNLSRTEAWSAIANLAFPSGLRRMMKRVVTRKTY
jgi:hypothetical protein